MASNFILLAFSLIILWLVITSYFLWKALSHYNKLGKGLADKNFVRFNPFKDTGGDQSFIISLVDGNDTGGIISGLYARTGTRWYAKKIVKGKSAEHELSDEEKKALKEAV